MVTITRLPKDIPAEIARGLERVVREVLADADEPLEVQFGTWPAEDGAVQFVCRVEGPAADPFGGLGQWRWWSPLVEGPAGLRRELSAAVRLRRDRAGAAGAEDRPATAISF